MNPLSDIAFAELQARLRGGCVELSRKQVIPLVLSWVDRKMPAAVVRFGEGEGRLLAARPDDGRSLEIARNKVRRQTGVKFSPAAVLEIKSLVQHALHEADVVAMRGSASFKDVHKMWLHEIELKFRELRTAGRKSTVISHCLLNNKLYDALPLLLKATNILSIVSCRNVKEIVAEQYSIQDVHIYQIPSQYVMRDLDDAYEAALHDVPIRPDFYRDLYENVTVREKGEIFLVGAGLFGKDLCIRIRDLGGIALDMGSRLDGMAGKATRGDARKAQLRERERLAHERGLGAK